MASRRYPNIQPRRDSRGLRWRARVQHLGAVHVGEYRSTQAEAHADAMALRAQLESARPGSVTLARALELVAEDARERGVAESTIRRAIECHARYLRAWWVDDVALREIDAEEVCRFVREALSAKRSPETIRAKDLPLLDRAFRAADMPSPVQAAKRRMRHALRGTPKLRRTLSVAEIAGHLETIRASGQPAAERHADLYLLIACTGIRAGELERLAAEDIDVAGAQLYIRTAKVRALPRVLPIPAVALPAAVRLVAGAQGGKILPGGMSTLSTMHRRWRVRLGEPRWTARNLRHAYATALGMGGAAVAALQAAMGHTQLKTTSRYVHGSTHGLQSLLDGLLGALGGSSTERAKHLARRRGARKSTPPPKPD